MGEVKNSNRFKPELLKALSGEFPYPDWHKKEKENILSNVGIKVE